MVNAVPETEVPELAAAREIVELLRKTPGRTAARTDKRAQILEAAIGLFAVHGFDAVGMRQLAAAVNLTAPGLYAHFDSKESIIAAAMKQALGDFIESVLLPAECDPPAERLEALVRRHVVFQLEKLPLTKANDRLLDGESMRHFLGAAEHRILVTAQRVYYGALRDLIRARTADASDEQVRITTFAVLAMCERVTTWYRPGGGSSIPEVAEHLGCLVRSMVEALGAAP